ncbi:hypothetical protein WJX79_004774 [Trebouxia sp. C0005]
MLETEIYGLLNDLIDEWPLEEVPSFDIVQASKGSCCTADPDSSPAGADTRRTSAGLEASLLQAHTRCRRPHWEILCHTVSGKAFRRNDTPSDSEQAEQTLHNLSACYPKCDCTGKTEFYSSTSRRNYIHHRKACCLS